MRCMRFFLFALAGTGLAFGHPNGTSKIAVRLEDPDSILLVINVNHDDLVNAVHLRGGIEYGKQVRAEGAHAFEAVVTEYLRSRIRLQVDHRLLEGLPILR